MVIWLVAPAAALVAPQDTAPVDEPSVEEQLRRARNEYAYGNYAKAAELLEGLLYPMRLYSDAQVIEARRFLALSYYLLGRRENVREEFVKILYLDPDYELDPFTIAPPVISLFETVRRELKSELDVIRQRISERQLEKVQPEGILRTVETRIVERSDWATLLPFGVGQFQNGDTAWGVGFAVTQGLLLALNIGAYMWLLTLDDYRPDEEALVNGLRIAQYASLAAFGVTWSFGVVHARLNFVPEVVNPPVVTDQPLAVLSHKQAPSWGGRAHLTFRF